MKKLTLKGKFEPDFWLLGIVSQVKNYQLCWFINKVCGLNFERTDILPNHQEIFPIFKYQTNESLIYFLITNQTKRNYLLPNLSAFDYLLKIEGNIKQEEVDALKKDLQNIQAIQLVNIIDVTKIQGLDKLIF